MVRFSRDKRFFLRITFEEYLVAATQLTNLVRERQPGALLEILTCEDVSTYNYSTVAFWSDEVTEALKTRRSYSLGELSPHIWKRAFKIEMAIRDPSVHEPFVVWLTVDRIARPRRLGFFYQCVSDALEADLAVFKRPSPLFGIGDGYSKPSDFNFNFGQRITGISLL